MSTLAHFWYQPIPDSVNYYIEYNYFPLPDLSIHSNHEGYVIHNILYVSFGLTALVDIFGKYK